MIEGILLMMVVMIVISLKGREGDILRLVTLVRLRRLSLDSLRSAEKIRRRRVGDTNREPRLTFRHRSVLSCKMLSSIEKKEM